MATDFEFTLHGGEDAGGVRRYAPGSDLNGTLVIVPDAQITCNRLLVRVGWHTEGRGDRDAQTVAEIELFRGTLQAHVPASYDFAFQLPSAPWSYAGHYISIIWTIEANIDLSMAFDPRSSVVFMLGPSDQFDAGATAWGFG
jgi:hypothetical protein